jgi:hypothetical protein
MNLIAIPSCSLFIHSWLQDHLIPCPFKYFTGVDCPGCGFQRAVLALMQGNLSESLSLYPAAIPLLLFFLFGIANKHFKLDNPKGTITKSSFVIIGTVILVSYSIKLMHLYMHYKVSA